MKYKICFIGLSLVFGLASADTLWAQSKSAHTPVDTLRRSLKVMTTQENKLEVRTPMGFTLSTPKVYTAERQHFSPSALTRLDAPVQVGALTSLAPLPTLMGKSGQLGYLSGALGVRYNARLEAGVRPINTQTDYLDLRLNGRWTHYNPSGELLEQPIKEQSWGLGADYFRQSGNMRWRLSTSYQQDHQNFYGLLIKQQNVAHTDQEISAWRALKDDMWHRHYLQIGGSISSIEATKRNWHYHFAPSLAWVKQGELKELNPKVELRLGRTLSDYGRLNLDFKAEGLLYLFDRELSVGEPDRKKSLNDSYIQISPSWQIDGVEERFDWGILVGLGLASFQSSDDDKNLMLLWPRLDAHIGWSESWLLSAKIDGGVRSNGLISHALRLPRMPLLNESELTRIPFSSRLALSGLILPNFSLELYASYELMRNVEDYVMQGRALSSDFGSLPMSNEIYSIGGYKRFYRDAAPTHHYEFGAALAYTFYRAYTFKVAARSHQWRIKDGVALPSGEELHYPLSGRPNFELEASVHYRPNGYTDLSVGYQVQTGLGYRANLTYSNGVRTEFVDLPTFGVFSLSGAYRVGKRWTLTLDGQFAPGEQPSWVLGYPVQPFVANVGCTYTF